MTHGLTGGGVVVPGEDEHEVAIRSAALEARLGTEGDVLAALLIRQMAIASIRMERAFRHESALAAERVRRAADDYDDERQRMAAQILDQIGLDPVTARRRLLAAPEGIDALLGQLRALREKTEPQTYIAWDEPEGIALGHCLGHKPGQAPASRVELLTRAVVYDHWVGLDPATFADRAAEGRVLWAVAEIQTIIDAEIAHLETHRATLDPARATQGRAEAGQRSLLDLGKDGTALRRYAVAAERTIFKSLQEIHRHRAPTTDRASKTPATPATTPATVAPEPVVSAPVADKSASFCPEPRSRPRSGSRSVAEPVLTDLMGSFVPISVGRPPRRPVPPARTGGKPDNQEPAARL